MNPRKLIPLVVVLVVLVVLVFLFGRKKPQNELRVEAGLTRLAPEDFLVSDVGRLEVFLGNKKDEKVLLEREDSRWRIRSYFNAPGDGEKVSALLDRLKNLEGEFRVSDASVLDDFDLAEEKAIHFSVYKKKSEEAWLHLLVGKDLPNGGFARLKGEDSVYVLAESLRREVGLVTDDPSKTPSQSHWVDKAIIAVNQENIERLSIVWPDRKAVFERRKKADLAAGEGTEGASAQKGAPTPQTVEWVAEDPPFPIKENGIDGIARALSGLTATDIIDPQDKEEKGLADPLFRCTVTLEQGGETTLVASRPDPREDGYMMVEGGDGTIFRVPGYTFQQVFKAGKDLFELPSFSFDKEAIQRVSLTWPQGTLVLEKTPSGEFKIRSGGLEGQELRQEKAKGIWDSLPRVSPVDFVQLDPDSDRGLKEAGHQVTIVMKNGERHGIALGQPARGMAGRYMRIDDDPRIFVMAAADVDRILPPIDQIFKNPVTGKGG